MRTEWTPEQVAVREHEPRVVESGALIGQPARAVCRCGWKGGSYGFASRALRQEHAQYDADLHLRLAGDRS